MKKKRPQLETRKLQNEKLTSRGELTSKDRKPSTHKASRKVKSSKITYIHNKQLRDTQNN